MGGMAHKADGLLLIAHGTRNPAGAEEMDVLVARTAERLGVPVAHAWLEDFADPDAVTAVTALRDAGVHRVVTLPFLNFAAGHAKTDVPAEVAALRRANPDLDVRHGRVLGVHPSLLELGWRRLDAVSDPQQRAGEVLVVAASGSSDPDANGEVAKAARMLAEGSGHRWVEHCFAGVTWPRIGAVLARVAAAGGRRVVLFSWSLLAGLLEQRVAEAADEAADAHGLALLDAGRFGPDQLVVDAVAERFAEAVHGDVRANCDACPYRVALRGTEGRVGAPSAGGRAG